MKQRKFITILVLILMFTATACNLIKALTPGPQEEPDSQESWSEDENEENQELAEAEEDEVDSPLMPAEADSIVEDSAEALESHELLPAQEDIPEEIPADGMGTQPNWSLITTGCEEFFEQGSQSGFYPSESMDEIEFVGAQFKIILSMTKSWQDEIWWMSDFTDGNPTNDFIDLVIFDNNNSAHIFLPDYLNFYWEFEEDQEHIFGIIDFDARAYTADGTQEISPECVITGQFAFDNIPIK